MIDLFKKYDRGVKAISGVDAALVSARVGMGIGGAGLLCIITALLPRLYWDWNVPL